MSQIRTYQPKDASQLIKLLRLNTPAYFDPSEQAEFETFLKNSPSNYFVVEEDGKLLGCGGFDILEDGTLGRLTWDFFHPDAHGKGYGSQLINLCIDQLKEIETIKTIDVRTSQFAFTFYAQFFFELIEIKEDYWAKGFDLYYMKLVINRNLLQ